MVRGRRVMQAGLVLLVAATGALVAACGPASPAASAATPAAAPAAVPAGARVAWYLQCWAYFNAKNFAEFANCYTPDARSQQLGYGSPSSSGATAAVAAAREFSTAFPDIRGEPLLILADDKRIVGIHVLHGINSGPITRADGGPGKPTNRPLGLWFGHLVEVTASAAPQVRRELGVMDSRTVAAQLGWSKAPARPVITAPVAAPLTVVASHDAREAANLRAYAGLMAAWNRHDLAAVEDYYRKDYVQHVAAEAADFGATEHTAANIANWAAFSDARIDATTWAAGDYVVAEGVFTGTQDGEMPGMKLAPSGNKVAVPYLEIDRFAGGKVVEEWLFYDGAAFVQALGANAAAQQ